MSIRNNADRAERARAALETYQGTDGDDDCHLGDLITNLLHLAREEKRDLVPLVRNAVSMFEAEIVDPDGEDEPDHEFSICQELFGDASLARTLAGKEPEFSPDDRSDIAWGLELLIERLDENIDGSESKHYGDEDIEEMRERRDRVESLLLRLVPAASVKVISETPIPGEAYAAAADFLEQVVLDVVDGPALNLDDWAEAEELARAEDKDSPLPGFADIKAALAKAQEFLRAEGKKR